MGAVTDNLFGSKQNSMAVEKLARNQLRNIIYKKKGKSKTEQISNRIFQLEKEINKKFFGKNEQTLHQRIANFEDDFGELEEIDNNVKKLSKLMVGGIKKSYNIVK